MTKQNAELLQVLIRQVAQNVCVDRVLAENFLVLFEAKASQPESYFHGAALT